MTITITRKTAAIIAAIGVLACAGTATAKSLITGAQIANGTVASVDLANRGVKGIDIQKGTLVKAHFKAGQLPAGAQGPQGQQGPQGEQGPQGAPGLAARQVVTSSTVTSTSDTKFLVLACPAGKVALGGGGQILYPAGNWVGSQVALSSSLPNATGWTVRAIEAGPVAGPGTWQLEGYVVCAAVAA
jgi:hypothetical protein